MLASPIFHHSRHICLSLSISSFVTSLSPALLHTYALGVTSSPFLRPLGPLFFAATLSFSHARRPSFARGCKLDPATFHTYTSAQTLVSSLIPTQSSRFHLLPPPSPPGEYSLSLFRSLAVPYSKPNPKRAERYPHYHSCSRQRKVCLDPAFIPFPTLRCRPTSVRILAARDEAGESRRISSSSGVIRVSSTLHANLWHRDCSPRT